MADIDVFGDDHWRAHEVVVPGAYRQVCVELKLQNLAVCALDNAVLLSELEGSEFAAASGRRGSGRPHLPPIKFQTCFPSLNCAAPLRGPFATLTTHSGQCFHCSTAHAMPRLC